MKNVSSLSDEEIARMASEGNKEAVDEIFSRYKSLVISLSRKYFLIGGESEDLIQEGMCGLYDAALTFKGGKSSFKTYATHCIEHKMIDAVKKYSSPKRSVLSNAVSYEEQTELESECDPEGEMISLEDRKEFLKTLSKNLTDLEFKIIVMYMDGMSYDEISKSTGKSRKSIDGALRRAKTKLFILFK